MSNNYYTNANRLSSISDTRGDIVWIEDFEGTLSGTGHYVYNFNGNLTRDDYK